MFKLEQLLRADLLAGVLGPQYEHFAQPVQDALSVFVSGLSQKHQQEVLARQATLPPSVSISQRLFALARCCPVLHKLGQIVARDRRLSQSLRRELQRLESLPSATPRAVIRRELAAQLGPLDTLGVELEAPTLAEASVAVVVPFTVRRGMQDLPQRGVFKILKPGIEERLAEELDLLERVGQRLDERCHDLHVPQLDYERAFRQVRERLQNEVRLDHERLHLEEARELYAGDRRVLIPRLFPFCGPRVTAMERVFGTHVGEAPSAAAAGRRLARLIAEALLAQPVFSRQARAMFHCDPHVGNLMVTDNERLAILDWSLVGHLGEADRSAISRLMAAALTFDADRILELVLGLARHVPAELNELRSVVAASLHELRRGRAAGLCWLVELLDRVTQQAGLRFPADLMMFRKTLYTLRGVAAEIGGDDAMLDAVMARQFAVSFVSEWPARWFSAPASRDFATRLSNVDIGSTLAAMPLAAVRLWKGYWTDLATGPSSC